jgi:hypothetical protein
VEILLEYKDFITVAIIATLIFSYGYIKINIEYSSTIELIWSLVHYFSMGIVIYVLIGFKLFKRVDTLLDRKFADDEPQKKKK